MISSLDPLSYGVDGLRGALIGSATHFGVATDWVVLTTMTAALVALGSYLFSRIQC